MSIHSLRTVSTCHISCAQFTFLQRCCKLCRVHLENDSLSFRVELFGCQQLLSLQRRFWSDFVHVVVCESSRNLMQSLCLFRQLPRLNLVQQCTCTTQRQDEQHCMHLHKHRCSHHQMSTTGRRSQTRTKKHARDARRAHLKLNTSQIKKNRTMCRIILAGDAEMDAETEKLKSM